MTDDRLFSKRTLIALISAAAVGLVGMVAMNLFGEDLVPQSSAGANAYSYSAIGHRAAVETLRRSGYNVIVSRHNSAQKAGTGGILVLAEPRLPALTADFLNAYPNAQHVLLVLPKWQGEEDPTRRGWLKRAAAYDDDYVKTVLATLVRHKNVAIVRNRTAAPFSRSFSSASPTLNNRQLLNSPFANPIIADSQGALLAKFSHLQQTIWVLSDPDILSNHGLGKGRNAELLVDIVGRINPTASALVVDETLHGFERRPSLWYATLEFPFVAVTLCSAVALAVFLWAAIGRFGAPLPTPPALALGKAGLIANTAGLLRAGGYVGHVLERYAEAVIGDVATRLHCPHGAGTLARLTWLDELGTRRGMDERIASIHRDAIAAARDRRPTVDVASLARRLYRWKQEMLNGS